MKRFKLYAVGLTLLALLGMEWAAAQSGPGPVPSPWTVNGLNVYYSRGPVGVGTSNPLSGQALTVLSQATVQGASAASPGWYAQVTGDAQARVRVGLNSSDVGSLAFGSGTGNRDTFLERAAAADIRHGGPDAATPVPQIESVQNVLAGTTNTAGALWKFLSSAGTGTGAGGGYEWDVAPAGSTGSTQNTYVAGLTLSSTALASTLPASFGNVNVTGSTIPSGAGVYTSNGTNLDLAASGALRFLISSSVFEGTNGNAPEIISGAASCTVPGLVGNRSATTTGYSGDGTKDCIVVGGADVADFTSTGINAAAIGASTASTGAFTTLSATGAFTASPANLNDVLAPTGTGAVTINPATLGTINNMAVGQTTPAAVAATTLSASSTVSGTGFSTYLASPPAIGGTAPSTGKFTTAQVGNGSGTSPTLFGGTSNTGLAFTSTDILGVSGGVESFDFGPNLSTFFSSASSQQIFMERTDSPGANGNIIGRLQGQAFNAAGTPALATYGEFRVTETTAGVTTGSTEIGTDSLFTEGGNGSPGTSASIASFAGGATPSITLGGAAATGTVTIPELVSCTTGVKTNGAGLLSCITSDESLKIPEGSISSKQALNILNRIPAGEIYKWHDPKLNDDRTHIGLYAQDVCAADSYLCAPFKRNGETYYNFDDRGVLSLLVKAIQEQQAEIAELQRNQ
jgi:hypothetical protein